MSNDINYKEALEYKYGKMPMAILHNHTLTTEDKFVFSVLYSFVDYRYVHDDPQQMHFHRLSFLTGISVFGCKDIVKKLAGLHYIEIDEANYDLGIFTYRFTPKAFLEYKYSKINSI